MSLLSVYSDARWWWWSFFSLPLTCCIVHVACTVRSVLPYPPSPFHSCLFQLFSGPARGKERREGGCPCAPKFPSLIVLGPGSFLPGCLSAGKARRLAGWLAEFFVFSFPFVSMGRAAVAVCVLFVLHHPYTVWNSYSMIRSVWYGTCCMLLRVFRCGSNRFPCRRWSNAIAILSHVKWMVTWDEGMDDVRCLWIFLMFAVLCSANMHGWIRLSCLDLFLLSCCVLCCARVGRSSSMLGSVHRGLAD